MKYGLRGGVLLVAAVILALTVSARTGYAEELEGLLEANEEVEISSNTPGIVDEILVERGDKVTKGQILARLQSGVEQAEVELAQAQVEFNTRKAERNEELSKKKLISTHEKDELETELQIRKLELAEVKERLNLRIIRSPVNGVVLKRASSPGEYVGENVTLMTVVQIDPLNVEVICPVERWGTIKKGMKAEVRPEKPVEGVYIATVTIIDPIIDAASGSFGVRLQMSNPSSSLPAGLKCRVRFLKN